MRVSLAFLLLLAGCTAKEEKLPLAFEGCQMTIEYRILIGDESVDRDLVQTEIEAVFALVNTTFNNWNPNSELSILNRTPANEIVPLSSELERFLHKVDQLVQLTNGRFDPTIAPLHQVWKNALVQGATPTPQQCKEAARLVGWNKLHIEDGNCWKEVDGLTLDLCGTVKGYCVDLLAKHLQKIGINNLFIDWGGEICAIGLHPSNRSWQVAIRSPNPNQPALAAVALCDETIATSGNYVQLWEVTAESPKIYTHICDPTTLQALTVDSDQPASVTVRAPECWIADGLATALMITPTQQEATELIARAKKQIPNSDYWLIYPPPTHLNCSQPEQ